MKKQLFQLIGQRLRLNQKAAVFILCFLVSVIFWVFTSLSREYETHISIPVNYRNMPFTKYFDSDLPQTLDFHFKGSGFKLSRVHLRDRPDSIIVDIASFSDKKKQLNFQTLALKNQFPGELKPYKISPETITAGFNSRLSKRVPVILNGNIVFRKRFEPVGSMQLIPDSVDLAGPKNFLEKIKAVKTKSVKLEDVAGDKKGYAVLDSNSFPGLVSSSNRIQYQLEVEEYTEGMISVPVELPVSQQSRVVLIPNTVKITYAASLSDFPQVKSSDFIVVTEVSLSEMPAKLHVKLRKKPESVRVVKIEPEYVDYIVNK